MIKKTLMITIICVFVVAGIAAGNAEAVTQVPLFPNSIETIDRNPAMLGESDYGFHLKFSPLFMQGWNNSWTAYQVVDYLVIGRNLEEEGRKDELLDSISAGEFGLGTDVRSGLAFGSGSWGARTGIQAEASAALDKELFELVFEGADFTELEVNLDQTSIGGRAVADIGYSQAFPIDDLAEEMDLELESLYAGGGLHYLLGLGWADGSFNGEVTSQFDDEDTHLKAEGDLNLRFASLQDGPGHGLALNAGIWGRINPELGAGISLNNLGFIRWGEIYEIKEEARVRVEHPLTVDEENDDFYDYEFPEEEPEIEETGSGFVANPISLTGEVHYEFDPRLHFGGSVGINTFPRFNLDFKAAARTYFPEFMPLTLMLGMDTYKMSPSLSFNLGLNIFSWEALQLHVSDIKLLTGHGQEFSVGLSTGLRF